MKSNSTTADLEIRIFEKQEDAYPVELTLNNQLQFARGTLASDFLPWVASTSPTADGERLFGWLFNDQPLYASWNQVRGQHPRHRIRLRIDATAPELHAIPWELLRDPGDGATPPRDLTTSANTPFSRYIAGTWPAGEPVQERPIKILAAIANPTDLDRYRLARLDVGVERSLLLDATAELAMGRYLLTFLDPPVTLDRIHAELQRGYHVLHILAHGAYRDGAYLFLEDGENKVARTAEANLAQMIGQLGQCPRLIFLASCQSATRDTADAFRGLAPQLVKAGVPAVLAMQDLIPIDTARAFTRTFYRQLFRHGAVDRAGNEARAELLSARARGTSIPVLFSRLPDNQLLQPAADGIDEVMPFQPFEPETVIVLAGAFWMGASPDDAAAEAWEKPGGEVWLGDYRIGKVPVTNEQYLAFIKETGHDVPRVNWIGRIPHRDKRNHPVVGVSWEDAQAYCRWLADKTKRHYRLPSEAEWEKAARGEADRRVYPWGDAWEEDRCNRGKATTPVDHYPHQSPYGCRDMLGNVWEWTSTCWGSSLDEDKSDFPYPWQEDGRDAPEPAGYEGKRLYRIYRGGAHDEGRWQLRCSARDWNLTGTRDLTCGFRVVWDLGAPH